jgi:hypothetical protein
LEKQVKRDKEQPVRKKCNRPIEEKERWSAVLTDGQKSPTLSIDELAGQSDRPMVNQENRPMERKKALIKEIRQRQGGGGSIYNWQRLRVSFRRV